MVEEVSFGSKYILPFFKEYDSDYYSGIVAFDCSICDGVLLYRFSIDHGGEEQPSVEVKDDRNEPESGVKLRLKLSHTGRENFVKRRHE